MQPSCHMGSYIRILCVQPNLRLQRDAPRHQSPPSAQAGNFKMTQQRLHQTKHIDTHTACRFDDVDEHPRWAQGPLHLKRLPKHGAFRRRRGFDSGAASGLFGDLLHQPSGLASGLFTRSPPRTKWTRRVPHPVLIGHAASLSQVLTASSRAPGLPTTRRRWCTARTNRQPETGWGLRPSWVTRRQMTGR